jgi:hypothetical protein
MNPELRDEFGMTASEVIAEIPLELHRDGVGIHQIVGSGRDDFHLVGPDLVDFVRRGIHALLDAGAVPVRFGGGSGFDWVAQKQYGTDKEQITEVVIEEWLALPLDPVVLFSKGVWFADPSASPRMVKTD